MTQAIDELDITTYLVWDMNPLTHNPPYLKAPRPTVVSLTLAEGEPFGFQHDKFLFRDTDH